MARKAVRTITVSGVSLPIYSAQPFSGATVESDNIAAFGDETFTTIPRNIAEWGEITITCIDEGESVPVKPGDITSITITTTYTDGTTESTRTATKNCAILEVSPGGEIAVDGERKATITVRIKPVGGDSLSGSPFAGTGA